MNILICIPYFKTISRETLASCDALKDRDGYHFRFSKRGGSVISSNRNDQMDDDGWSDGVLLVDADMGFTFDDVISVTSHDVDICAGAYPYKNDATKLVAGTWIDGYPGCIDNSCISGTDKQGLHRMPWAGAGFLWITRNGLKKLIYPYFCERVVKVPPGQPHSQRNTGEDIGFAMMAAECGVDIWVDFDVRIKHYKDGAMPDNKTVITSDIASDAMSANSMVLRMAEKYAFVAAALKEKCAECEKLKEELKNLKV